MDLLLGSCAQLCRLMTVTFPSSRSIRPQIFDPYWRAVMLMSMVSPRRTKSVTESFMLSMFSWTSTWGEIKTKGVNQYFASSISIRKKRLNLLKIYRIRTNVSLDHEKCFKHVFEVGVRKYKSKLSKHRPEFTEEKHVPSVCRGRYPACYWRQHWR